MTAVEPLGCSIDGPLAGTPRGEALVVFADRGEQRARPHQRADADVLRLQAREVAERERPVVAVDLLGRDPGKQRIADFERFCEVFKRQRDDRVVGECSSACADSARRVFRAVAAARLTAPTEKACPSCGATVRSELALGRSRRMNSAAFS